MTTRQRRIGTKKAMTAQRGLSLIELMIAMLVGAILVTGILSVFLSTSQNFRASTQRSNVEDAGDIAMYLIGDAIRQAGYGQIVGQDIVMAGGVSASMRANTLFDDWATAVFGCSSANLTDNTATVPTCGSTVVGGQDTLMVRFQGDSATDISAAQGTISNCLNQNPQVLRHYRFDTNRPVVHNVYYVQDGSLHCATMDSSGTLNQAELIANIESFRLLFGFDEQQANNPRGFETPRATKLYSASQVPTIYGSIENQQWEYVVNVHVCMVVRSDELAGQDLSLTRTYSRCPTTQAEAEGNPDNLLVTATDGVLRKTYRRVFTLRSRSAPNPI